MRKTLILALATMCATALSLVTPPAPAAAACSGTIQITSLAFSSPQATPGQIATATVVAQNCTNQPQNAIVMFVGRFIGSSPGIPAGCPAIDPLAKPAPFAAGGTYTTSVGYLIFAGCTATSLRVTVTFTDSTGAVVATQSAEVPIVRVLPCAVTHRTTSQWSSGFVADVTVANTGTAAVNGWSLAYTYPGDQHVTSAWNATVRQIGAAVTATNVAYNATRHGHLAGQQCRADDIHPQRSGLPDSLTGPT